MGAGGRRGTAGGGAGFNGVIPGGEGENTAELLDSGVLVSSSNLLAGGERSRLDPWLNSFPALPQSIAICCQGLRLTLGLLNGDLSWKLSGKKPVENMFGEKAGDRRGVYCFNRTVLVSIESSLSENLGVRSKFLLRKDKSVCVELSHWRRERGVCGEAGTAATGEKRRGDGGRRGGGGAEYAGGGGGAGWV